MPYHILTPFTHHRHYVVDTVQNHCARHICVVDAVVQLNQSSAKAVNQLQLKAQKLQPVKHKLTVL